MKGFFPASQLVSKSPATLVPKCGACRLYLGCDTPKMQPTGEGRRKILIIGEAPGETEDDKGIQFIGKSGQLLKLALRRVGIDMRRDCWLTNSLICHPPRNAQPTIQQLEFCRPNLVQTLDKYQPEIVIPVGDAAVKSLLPLVYKEQDLGSISRWVGWQIPSQKRNMWICPTYHPSYVARQKENNDVVTALFFHKHLKAASKLSGRPWETVPDYESEIEIIRKTTRAASILRGWIKKGGTIAFDYEGTALKPETPGNEIVCCSVCWMGRKTISFPWYGEAIEAMREVLYSDRLEKIASNFKFEDRHTRQLFGGDMKGWKWCTMTNAHILDHRPGVTSIKFQAFVLLGTQAYDEHIKPYLRAKKDHKLNRIREEVNQNQLLLYCGLDSLLEYKVAEIQMKQLGISM